MSTAEHTFAAHASREHNTDRSVVLETTPDLLEPAGQAPERNHEAHSISLQRMDMVCESIQPQSRQAS